MPVGAHGERTAVAMSKPTGNGRDIDARFNAGGRKKVAKIVMGDSREFDFSCCGIHRLLCFVNS